MRASKIKSTVLSASCLTTVALLFSAPCSAEKFDQTYVKTNYRTITKSSTMINDGSNHEVKQEVVLSDIVLSKFGPAQEMVYIISDEIDGTGPHRGHYVDTYADGSQCFGSFEGASKTVSKADGAWEATWEGTYRYLGGSGKCKGIKGTGTYKGGATSTQAPHETGNEAGER